MNLGTASAVLDGAGAARATVGPQRAGIRWNVRRAVLRASGGTKPTARLYLNSESVATFLDGTASADQNSADYPAGLDLFPGQSVLVVWSAGTPGASVALILDGDLVLGR